MEARGVAKSPPGVTLIEPVPWQVEPTLDLAGKLTPRLSYDVALAPRLLLLAPPDGGSEVHSTAGYYAGSATLTWEADERTTLTLGTTGSRGTLAMSALTQLTGPPTTPGATPPGGSSLDPAAGVRTGEYGSASLRTAAEWKAGARLTLGGALLWAHAGGLDEASRVIYPTVNGYAAEARGSLDVTAADALALQAGYTRTLLAIDGTVGIADLVARWTRRFGPDLEGSVAAGVASTVEDGLTSATAATAGRVLSARYDATLTSRAPDDRAGFGFDARLGYAPYVDRYANAVLQRFAGSARAEWRLDPVRRLTWTISGATAIGANVARQDAAATEVGGWHRWGDLEAGLTLGAGYQASQQAGGATWQWNAGLAARWRQGPTR